MRYISLQYILTLFMSPWLSVSLQVPEEAVIAGSVVLPCSSAEHDLKLQDINVHWRHNYTEIVYNIIKGEDSLAFQNPRYKKRAETFPEEYLRGNFSLRLNNLTHADAGDFICYITHSSESNQETVQLIINELTEEKGDKSSEQENQGKTLPGSAETPWYWLILPVIFLIIIAACCIIIHKRKRAQAAL